MVDILLIISYIIIYYLGTKLKYFPFYFNKPIFSIGLMYGNSPFHLSQHNNNPIITPNDIKDFKCRFVADPFLYKKEHTWYIFYEAMDVKKKIGKICFSYSDDLKKWKYGSNIIIENFHLSYPYIFNYNNDIYIIPETSRHYDVRLYKCIEFPFKWELCKILLRGRYTEPSFVFHNDKCYLFITECDSSILRLYYADNLLSNWYEHPQSPIVTNNKTIARSAGKIISYNSQLYRFSQDCKNIYGKSVSAHKIIELNEGKYSEKECRDNPILYPSKEGWNSERMHHIHAIEKSPGDWIAVVDGLTNKKGIYLNS